MCGRILVVEVDQLYDHDPIKLIPMATCNRCYDYRTARVALEESIARVCGLVAAAIYSHHDTSKLHSKLVELTRKLAACVCDFHLVADQWDVAFPDMLSEKPSSCNIVMRDYRHGIEKIAHANRSPTSKATHPDP
jgi:hypothetical protein